MAIKRNKDDTSKKAIKKKPQNKPKDENYKYYQKWLRSKGFKELRQKALERDNFTCRVTGRSAADLEGTKVNLVAHHIKYDNCGKGDQSELDDVIILSSSAHRAIHSAKSHLRLFTDKSKVKENIMKYNPNLECKL